jgi:hypothetical protein
MHFPYNYAKWYPLFIIIDISNTYMDLTYKTIYPCLGTYISVLHVLIILLLQIIVVHL